MFSWFWRRKSNPAPQTPADAARHTPPAATPVAANHRAQTWPHAVAHEGSAPRDVHRHAPRDAYELGYATPGGHRDARDPQLLTNRLDKVAAWRRSGAAGALTPIQTDVSPGDKTPTLGGAETGGSDSSSSYSGFGGLGWKMSGSIASLASAPGHMQHNRRTSSSRLMTINFNAWPKQEQDDPNLATYRMDAGREAGAVFPMELQLPERGQQVAGMRRVSKSAWETVDH